MTEANHEYASNLSAKLKDFSAKLDDDEKELLAGILSVAHGLKDAAANGNGTAEGLVSGFRDAFDPLPADKIQMILNYKDADDKNGDDPTSISYKPGGLKDEPNKPDDQEQPES